MPQSPPSEEIVAPIAVAGILASIWFMFFLLWANTGFGVEFNTRTLIDWGALNGTLVVRDHQYWRLLTAGLLHAGIVHIGLNSLALYFCWRLETLIGTVWFLAIFVVSVLGGSLASLAINPLVSTSVGASGGILGLLAAQAIDAYHLEPGSQFRRAMQEDAMRILVPTLVPVLFIGTSGGGVQKGVDVAAHLGGAIAGAALGLVRLAKWGD